MVSKQRVLKQKNNKTIVYRYICVYIHTHTIQSTVFGDLSIRLEKKTQKTFNLA